VAHADATQTIPAALFGEEQFDRIFISYSLSIIPQWQAALDVALASLAPQGELHIVDFGRQDNLPRWFRAGLRRWLAHFEVTPCDALEQELAVRARRLRSTLRLERPYRGYAQYAVVRLAA
jgi:S-adenosylmethionine-diacylgycerolhomoserine-N-methlytransferase